MEGMMRWTERKRLRGLRREYRRERGRHDRCWDSVMVGRAALRNAKRRAFDAAGRELSRAMGLALWGQPQRAKVVEYLGPGKGYR